MSIYIHTHPVTFFQRLSHCGYLWVKKENFQTYLKGSQTYLKELAWALRALPKIEIHYRKFPQSIYLFGNKFQGHEFHHFSQLILLIFCESSNAKFIFHN